jgi:hypothetical protein
MHSSLAIHKTRVSEMRLLLARAPQETFSIIDGLESSTPHAQELSHPLRVSG